VLNSSVWHRNLLPPQYEATRYFIFNVHNYLQTTSPFKRHIASVTWVTWTYRTAHQVTLSGELPLSVDSHFIFSCRNLKLAVTIFNSL
jgi:hypothetical protein